jgi:hypothetical protein
MSLMDLASGWYASSTFWAGAGVVAVIVSTAAVVWVTLTVGLPRRRLYYRMKAVAPLMIAPEGVRDGIELLHRGKLLTDPRALTIELLSRGRKDIPSNAYNDGQPLWLDVGAPIVEILQVTSVPTTLPIPDVTADGTSVNLGPSLIGKRHVITITVLTDGGNPALTCRSPLVDVQVRQRSDEPSMAARVVVSAVAAAVVAGASTWAASLLSPAPEAAWCAATASVISAPQRYNNVYVHSNQPSTFVAASGDGYSWGLDTDGSGYAVIYFNGPPAHTPTTVRVGRARCTATWTSNSQVSR